jgi:hypothetical protein
MISWPAILVDPLAKQGLDLCLKGNHPFKTGLKGSDYKYGNSEVLILILFINPSVHC